MSRTREKTERFGMRLSAQELSRLAELQQQLPGMSKADIIRILLAGAKLADRASARELIYQVNRIGNNLNQIAHWVNAEPSADSIAVLTQLLKIERSITDLIHQKMMSTNGASA